jgi:hypothetical protein
VPLPAGDYPQGSLTRQVGRARLTLGSPHRVCSADHIGRPAQHEQDPEPIPRGRSAGSGGDDDARPLLLCAQPKVKVNVRSPILPVPLPCVPVETKVNGPL